MSQKQYVYTYSAIAIQFNLALIDLLLHAWIATNAGMQRGRGLKPFPLTVLVKDTKEKHNCPAL